MIDIIIFLLILMGAWLQSRHGIFQALITLLSCFFAAAVSVNLYQYLATNYLSAFPTYAAGVSLAVLFVAVFSMLRFGLQFLVIHDIHFGKLADTIGGAVVGVVCGLVLGGMLALVVQTLPMGAKVLGHQPYGENFQRSSSVALGCDNLVLSIAGSASDAMPGEKTLSECNGDEKELLLTLQCRRNTAGHVLRNVYSEESLFKDTKLYRVHKEGPGKPLVAVANPRVPVQGKSAHYMLRQQVAHLLAARGELDEDGKRIKPWWRLPASHFAILAEKKLKGQPTVTRRFYPVAYVMLDSKNRWIAKTSTDRNLLSIVRPEGVFAANKPYLDKLIADGKVKERGRNNWQLPAKSNFLSVDWLYCIPDGFVPKTFVYRDQCVIDLKVSKVEDVLDFMPAEPELRFRALRPMPVDPKAKKKKPKAKPRPAA